MNIKITLTNDKEEFDVILFPLDIKIKRNFHELVQTQDKVFWHIKEKKDWDNLQNILNKKKIDFFFDEKWNVYLLWSGSTESYLVYTLWNVRRNWLKPIEIDYVNNSIKEIKK